MKSYKALRDTIFNTGSHIENITLDSGRTEVLADLCLVWGFLKYYHPAVARGDYNWDAELFRLLPAVIKTTNKADAYSIIEHWVDGLEPVPECDTCMQEALHDNIKMKADFGNLFAKGNLPASLAGKLAFILNNRKATEVHYYVHITDNIGNPDFGNEYPYKACPYPDAGVRLLTLFRYWNIIQYFYPNRHLIGEDWHQAISRFIPKFIQARNQSEYVLACLELIGSIHDTHANIWSQHPILDTLKGTMIIPFQAKFIEHQLVVTGYYNNDAAVRQQVRIGDIIEKIDGIYINDAVKKYLPYSPASNLETQLRVMASGRGFLLRSNNNAAQLSVKRGAEKLQVSIMRIPVSEAYTDIDRMQYPAQGSFRLIQKNIGYIYPCKLQDQSIDTIKEKLGFAKGIIIDLRCYPSAFMPFTYGAWLKGKSTPFVKFSTPDIAHPGTFIYTQTLSNGEANKEYYKGKITILVNEMTQSQAEYTAMALRSGTEAVVIGSTTAGADGNISKIVLPGGIVTAISGIGVYYPDGRETQRIGIVPDIEVRPTIEGVRQGRDEVLERAIEYISNGK